MKKESIRITPDGRQAMARTWPGNGLTGMPGQTVKDKGANYVIVQTTLIKGGDGDEADAKSEREPHALCSSLSVLRGGYLLSHIVAQYHRR